MRMFLGWQKTRNPERKAALKRNSRRKVMASRRKKVSKKGPKTRFWSKSGGMKYSRAMVVVIVVVSLWISCVALFRERGIIDVLNMAEQVASMRLEMERLSEENSALKTEIDRLENDNDEVERIARDVLGLVRVGDTVYEFIEK